MKKTSASAGLSLDANPTRDKALTKAELALRLNTVSKTFTKHDYYMRVPTIDNLPKNVNSVRQIIEHMVKEKMVFQVRSRETDDLTGFSLSALLVKHMYERGDLVRKDLYGMLYLVHYNDSEYGFNPTNVNYGLPRSVRVGKMQPGDVLMVRFLDAADDRRAILIHRDGIDKTNGPRHEYMATVLYQMDRCDWDRQRVGFHQIMAHEPGRLTELFNLYG